MSSLESLLRERFQDYAQLPWLFLLAISLPMIVLALRRRVYPTWWWMLPLTISLVLATLTILFPVLLLATAIIDLMLLLVVTADVVWLFALGWRGIDVARTIPRTVSLGVPLRSRMTIENRTNMRLRGMVRDDVPEDWSAHPSQHPMNLGPLERMRVETRLTPGRRGAFELERVDLRYRSPFGFWKCLRTFEVHDPVNVYPDMKQLGDYALLARTNRLSQIGVRRTRRIGQDSNFERLRDYSRDDNYRHIDWRSTARRRKLTVRQFQSDQSQRVIFMLDCGRMMTNTRDGYSLLDHALNSMLMLSYVALHQGDSVGLVCFSDTIHAFIPPRGGPSQMNRLIQAGFDRFPRLVESRYDQAFLHLDANCKKRSLIVLATNLIDEVNAATLVDYLTNLSGRHLPLAVLLRDREMFAAADGFEHLPHEGDVLVASTPDEKRTLYRSAIASDILLWRNQVIRDLQTRGVLTIDAFPEDLTAPLVNEYLNIKAKHLL